MSAPDELAYADILERAAELATSLLECGDERVAAEAEELLDWLDAYHREGLGRLVEMVRQWRGELFLEQAALDPVVGEMLATYGLGTDTDPAAADRVIQLALDEVRPYIHSHGGEVEVTSVSDGSCSCGCTAPATAAPRPTTRSPAASRCRCASTGSTSGGSRWRSTPRLPIRRRARARSPPV